MRIKKICKSLKPTRFLTAAALSSGLAFGSANAAMVTVGPGGFDNGWATQITYDDEAQRGTSNGRANPLNALGAADGAFFEIGSRATADFSFGTQFSSELSIYEITFGNVSRWKESVDVYAGIAGDSSSFQFAGSLLNSAAQGGGTLSLVGLSGLFDTVRLVDTSPLPGNFDIDAVRVAPVPLPAAAWLFLTAVGGFLMLSRKRACKA